MICWWNGDADGVADRVFADDLRTGYVDVDADGSWDVKLVDNDADGAADHATTL